MEERVHILSASLFVLICLLFFLPFVNIECANQRMITVSGIDLVTGFELKSPGFQHQSQAEQKADPNVFAIIAIVSACCGIFFSLYHRLDRIYLKSSVIACSTLITLALLALQIEMSSRVGSQAKGVMVRVNYEIGYWLCLTIPILLNAIVLLGLKESTSKPGSGQ